MCRRGIRCWAVDYCEGAGVAFTVATTNAETLIWTSALQLSRAAREHVCVARTGVALLTSGHTLGTILSATAGVQKPPNVQP